jgi:outer membrane autotransporter protein
MQEERGKAADPEDSTSSSTDTKTTFGTSGVSLLFNATDGNLERLKTGLERGYETDSTKIQLGLDYRINDDWLLGALLGWDKYDTRYEGAAPGRNFVPGDSEGDSDADNINLSVFTTLVIGDSFYLDALASYSSSDYTFRRIGLFQEATRSTPTIDVVTSANTEGNQLALSIGVGWDKSYGANMIQIYARLGRFSSSVDPYSETGGAGFAMSVENKDTSETAASVGFKYSRTINTSFGVLVPQIYVEYENAVDSEVSESLSSFVADASGTEFQTLGDTPDETSARLGLALLGSFPDGWTGFISINKLAGKEHTEEFRITAGIRVEL